MSIAPLLARHRVVIKKDSPMEQKTRQGGFASMDEHKQREIARKGGMAAHRKGTAHEFTAEEARFAGRKGGQQVSANRSHMIEIGRLGGRRSAERRRSRMSTTQHSTHASEESSHRQAVGSSDSSMRQPGGNMEEPRQHGSEE
jgi:general stress protein YciG